MKQDEKTKARIYQMKVSRVYPLYIAKVERKGRAKTEIDEVICWLTGYNQAELEAKLEEEADFESFFAQAPALNPSRDSITGVICGIRVEKIEDPVIKLVRQLDKLVDELAKGKAMEKILRKA